VANQINEKKEKSQGGGIMKNKNTKPKKGPCMTFCLACCCCKTDNTVSYQQLDKNDSETNKSKGKGVNFEEKSAI